MLCTCCCQRCVSLRSRIATTARSSPRSIWMLDDARQTPAHTKYDGANYYPTTKWVLFGHHFAAITGAGPLVGPMLAAQFGWAPGLLWLVAGVCLAGAVHDSIDPVGLDPARRQVRWPTWSNSRSAASPGSSPARSPCSSVLVIAIAGLGIIVRERPGRLGRGAPSPSPPPSRIGMFMGLWMYVWRKGKITEATIIGVIAMLLPRWPAANRSTIRTRGSAASSTCRAPSSSSPSASTGSSASVLPVWLLLAPRGYLSSFTKIGTIVLLADRRDDREPRAADAGPHRVRRRRRADHPGAAVPLLLHHHRLRRHFRLPRPHQFGHHVEDARQGVRHPADRLRRHAGRRRGRHHGAHRRHLDAAGRLFRHQRASRPPTRS
jgi:hypothetical protein